MYYLFTSIFDSIKNLFFYCILIKSFKRISLGFHALGPVPFWKMVSR